MLIQDLPWHFWLIMFLVTQFGVALIPLAKYMLDQEFKDKK